MLGQLPVETAAPRGTVGQEADSLLGTVPHDPFLQRLPEERIEPILYRGDRHDRLGRANLGDGDIGEADPSDLAIAPQFGQRADALLEWNLGVGSVELVERDPLDA